MTIYDLLFIVLVVTAFGFLAVVVISALRGRWAQAFATIRRLAVGLVVYVAIVYIATAISKPVVLRVGDPQCDDDWCLAVERVERTPQNAVLIYDVSLRIFSQARRVAQRELVAKDVYLVDAQWKRYDPVPSGSGVPLNTLLQPGESVSTSRRFELPANVRPMGLLLERSSILPFCVIIGECGAFHKDVLVRLD